MFRNMAGSSDSVHHAEVQQEAELGTGLSSPGRQRIWLATLLGCGLLVRLYFAGFLFLDPDEALHYWVSVQPSLAAAYHATLSTAHPPLFILLLHYWRALGHSEIVLRLPGVVAGLAFCWIVYRWVARIADEQVASIALLLLLFTPSLIWLSGEVRQYYLLLFFIAFALYCFERAVAEQSIRWMVGFTLALDFALATHYSSLLFALTVGLYALVRLGSVRANRKLLVACALGQLSALIEVGIFFKTHISLLKKSGLPQEIADTWLRKSIFHPGEDQLISFLTRDTVRFFRYFFGNGIVGALGLAAFVLGLFLVLRKMPLGPVDVGAAREGDRRTASKVPALPGLNPEKRIRVLLLLPFAVCAIAALVGIYPYGGTRHDIFLAPFAILGISVALSGWKIRAWIRSAAILLALALANIFPSPAGPFIKPRDHAKSHMTDAIAVLRSTPPGSVIFTDYEGGLVLGYYLCDHAAVQPVPPYQPLSRSSCGKLTVVSAGPSGSTIGQQWRFQAGDFAEKVKEVKTLHGLSANKDLIVFRAGWSVSSDVELLKTFQNLGCDSPQYFGRNVLVCSIKRPFSDRRDPSWQ
jgi:4-amino-4-deoxy-L-arabinose transferase-like glycosyltransferase